VLQASEEKNRGLFKDMLLAAARASDAAMVEYLLQHTSLPVDYAAHVDGVDGCTLLYVASRSGHVKVVEFLLDSGAEAGASTRPLLSST